MRSTHTVLSLAALLALPGIASANCYSIYDAKNQLAFQSTVSPIDLSTRISQEMRARFPGGFLIIIPDDADCRELRTGPVVSPRFEVTAVSGTATPRNETLEASPLLRGAATAPISSDGSVSRETIRSGNNLTIRR